MNNEVSSTVGSKVEANSCMGPVDKCHVGMCYHQGYAIGHFEHLWANAIESLDSHILNHSASVLPDWLETGIPGISNVSCVVLNSVVSS